MSNQRTFRESLIALSLGSMGGLPDSNFQAAHLIGVNVYNQHTGFFNTLNAHFSDWSFDVYSASNGVLLPNGPAAQNALLSGDPPIYSAIHNGRGAGHQQIETFASQRLQTISDAFDDAIMLGASPADAARTARAQIEGLQHEIRSGMSSLNAGDVFLFNNVNDPMLSGSDAERRAVISEGIQELRETYANREYSIGEDGRLRVTLPSDAQIDVEPPDHLFSPETLGRLAGTSALIGGTVIAINLFTASQVLADSVREDYGSNSIANTVSYLARLDIGIDAEFLQDFVEAAAVGLIQDTVLTMMGFGLLVHGRDIVLLSGDLRHAISGLAAVTDSPAIDALDETINAVVTTVEGLFSTGGGANYVPSYVQMAEVLQAHFSVELQSSIATAVADYIEGLPPGASGAPLISPTVLQGIRATGDVVEAMNALQLVVGADTEGLQQGLETALLADQGLRREFPEIMRQIAMQSDACFLGETRISMWGGGEKRIDQIKPGDLVISYDANGALVPGRVTRTFVKNAKLILDVHGLMMTPGHVTLCGDGRFAGRHVPIIDILRSDGALVTKSGELIRAATGEKVGSFEDGFVEAVTVSHDADGVACVSEAGRLRLGTRYILPTGLHISIAGLIKAAGAKVTVDGMVRDSTGVEKPFIWPFGALPKPEDYVLARSNLPLGDIYTAGEWDQMPPIIARPSFDEASSSGEVGSNQPLSMQSDAADSRRTPSERLQ